MQGLYLSCSDTYEIFVLIGQDAFIRENLCENVTFDSRMSQ